ncbi:hypothetical protein [Flavobacterium sp.]|uniref:hypothetical protein n=1 Tax=Flavobacterium sp. TaxID=239 RepID=UPI00391C1571
MSIIEFMNLKIDKIRGIIRTIENDPFDSQEFIRCFTKEFELEYIVFLGKYDKEQYRKVHAQIALFLSLNKDLLNIKHVGVNQNPNVFGIESTNERWVKNY